METEDLDGSYKIGASSDYYDVVGGELALFENDLQRFDEMQERRSKIMELKNLMFKELKEIKEGLHIDPTMFHFEKSNEGYPLYMKNNQKLVDKYSLSKISDFRQNMTAI